MGLYFLESGVVFCNFNVVYDCEGFFFVILCFGMIDWEKIFFDVGWFYWLGIVVFLL